MRRNTVFVSTPWNVMATSSSCDRAAVLPYTRAPDHAARDAFAFAVVGNGWSQVGFPCARAANDLHHRHVPRLPHDRLLPLLEHREQPPAKRAPDRRRLRLL